MTPSDPSAKHFCQPDAGAAIGIRAEDVPAPEPAGQRRIEGVFPKRRHDTQRQPARLGEMRIGRIGPLQVGVRRHLAGVVRRDDAEAHHVERRRHERGLELRHADPRDVPKDQPRRTLEQHSLRRTVEVAANDPTRWIRRLAIHSRQRQRGSTRKQRVMVMRPQRAATAGRDGLEVSRRRPAAPAVQIPAATLEPGARIGERLVRGPNPRQAFGERQGVGQVELTSRDRGLRQVEMRVGQAG